MRRWMVAGVILAMTVVGNASDFRKMSRLVRQAATECHHATTATRSHHQPDNRRLTAFVCADMTEGKKVLGQQGCRIFAQWDDLFITSIPLDRLDALSEHPSIIRIEASQGSRLQMDTVATAVNATAVYQPSAARPAFTGRGVVMGLVDAGFDLTHPNFLDTLQQQYRIGAFWDQLSKDTVGSALPVGRDYVGFEAVRQQGHSADALTMTHGTHTMGIAAGGGYDTPYQGIAYESELCVVDNFVGQDNQEYIDSTDYYKYTTATDALGFKYCFDYAERQGKPCVVSFSEGYPPYLDEEDSLFAAALEKMTGPGRIIVASAGNENQELCYFHKPASQRAAGAFVRCLQSSALYRVKAEGDIRLSLYYYGSPAAPPTDTLCFGTAEVRRDSIMMRRLRNDKDTVSLSVYRDSMTFEGSDIWQLFVETNRPLYELPPLALVVEGNGEAEVFGSSKYAFAPNAVDSRWASMEGGHNILAPGSFSSVICVGATDHQGRELTYYSSTGPAMNGLTKPDVVAPGTQVVSSFCRYFYPEKDVTTTSIYEGETHYWGHITGTSMSTPVVAGVIALWLQACPQLTPQQVREVFRRTCHHPAPSSELPDNEWGFGEIDAYQGLLDILGLNGIDDVRRQVPSGTRIEMRPGLLHLAFDREADGRLEVMIYDLSGKRMVRQQQRIVGRTADIAIPHLEKGVYLVRLAGEAQVPTGSQLVRL